MTCPGHDDQVIRGDGHLVHQVAGHENGAPSLASVSQVPDPEDALRVETIDRLVEDEDLRIAQAARRRCRRWLMPRSSRRFAVRRPRSARPGPGLIHGDGGVPGSGPGTAGGHRRSGRGAWPGPRGARRPRERLGQVSVTACRRSSRCRRAGDPARGSAGIVWTCLRHRPEESVTCRFHGKGQMVNGSCPERLSEVRASSSFPLEAAADLVTPHTTA